MHESEERGRKITYAHRASHTVEVVECFEVSSYDYSGVNITLQEALNSGENFTGQDNNRSGSIADFLILCSRQFDHGFGSGVSNINLKRREP